MQFVKLQVTLRHNPDFRDLTDRAKVAYFGALMLTTDYEQDGVLRTWRGPLSRDELARDLMVSPRVLGLVLRELCNKNFLEVTPEGLYNVCKYREKTETPQASKMRELREKRALEDLHNAVTETVTVTEQLCNTTPVTVTEEVRDKSIDLSLSVAKATSRASRPKKAPDTSWVPDVVARAKAIAKVTLGDFTPDQRFDAGRYCALKFSNCCAVEGKNKRAAGGFAKGFAGMATSPDWQDLTFSQYVTLGRKYFERIGPFYDAWAVKGEVEHA